MERELEAKAQAVLALLKSHANPIPGTTIHRHIKGSKRWTKDATMSIVGGLMAKKQVFSPRLGYFQLVEEAS